MSLTEPGRRRDGSSRSGTRDTLVSLPARAASPSIELMQRGLLALVLLLILVLIVWIDRDAYTDNYDGDVGLIDAIYYAT
ncbi:MAG TPA: potassium transporter Kef, partial [Propionibacteriaceae bacterium]|nr:potassium transporter Kef [Propionibacteriaceae bacterium]